MNKRKSDWISVIIVYIHSYIRLSKRNNVSLRLSSVIALILATFDLFGQTPQLLSYQAVVRDNANSLITNQTIGIRMSLLQGDINGLMVYSESHLTSTNANGLVTLRIGEWTVLSGNFASIDWSSGLYFLKSEIDPDGGVNYTITSACATSAHCIGNAFVQIQWNKQDIVFAGGGDEVHWTTSVLFDAMGALSSKYNDSPTTASRPYDVTRDGFAP